LEHDAGLRALDAARDAVHHEARPVSRATIERFYTAFAALDAASMQACYAPEARFEDEAFQLRGAAQIGGMWAMLCEGASSPQGRAHWKLDFEVLDEHRAHWQAHYVFTATGRRVHNRIDAEFALDAQGLILSHRDRFDFPGWARQALGLPGALLGWSPWLKNKVRAQAARQLERYLARRGG
jgi:hypothetical protein